jgi:hypothetical protein
VEPDSPNLTVTSPDNGINYNSTGNVTVTFNYTVFDQGQSTCALVVDDTITDVSYISGSTWANVSASGVFGEGEHLWNVTCTDSTNNSNSSPYRLFTVNHFYVRRLDARYYL